MTDFEQTQPSLCRSWNTITVVPLEGTLSAASPDVTAPMIDERRKSDTPHDVALSETTSPKVDEVSADAGKSLSLPIDALPPTPSNPTSVLVRKKVTSSEVKPHTDTRRRVSYNEKPALSEEKLAHQFSGVRGSDGDIQLLVPQSGESSGQIDYFSLANTRGESGIHPTDRTTSHSYSSSELTFPLTKSTAQVDRHNMEEIFSESITRQFNEIAKLNRGSLRGRRTVRPSASRVSPGTSVQSDVQDSLSDEGRTGATKTGCKWTSSIHAETESTDAALQTSSVYCVSSESRGPFHARFHSDDTTHVGDYQAFSPRSTDSTKRADYPVASSSSSSASNSRQPSTYVRSVTAERLPLVARNSSGVLRSKSAASTLPHIRSQIPTVVSVDPKAQELTIASCVPRSMPESSVPSQHHSGIHTESNEGSTTSIPSLNTVGDGSDVLPDSVNEHSILPDGYDPSSTTESVPDESMVTSETVEEKHVESEIPADHQTNDIHLMLVKRKHIVKEMIQVEKEYVNSLATLVNAYMVPLRQEKILDDQQVDTIFYKMNELLNFHLSFLNTLQMWELTNTVGDKLVDMFSREAVATCYCAFVENFPNSEKVLENCWNTKSSFQKFCEQRLRTLRSKLPLKALLVQPIQRIPRYELLVNRLIEYTPKTYSDSALLNEAKIAIHRLAVRVNTVQADGQDESMVEGARLLERLLAPAMLSPNRAYMRHDIVSLEDKKDPVCIFTFTDQLVFTVTRRRGNQAPKKPLYLRLQSPKGVDTIENIKYKIFTRLAMELIELDPGGESEADRLVQHRELRDKKDLALLAEIENITSKLDYRHHELDLVVRHLYQSVQQELEDLRAARITATAIPKNMSIITATTKEGIERYELIFPTSEKRQEWELTVTELKHQLCSVKRKPLFHGSVEISRTLPGIQLSCAAVVEGVNLTRNTPRDVWICAADGYTGYICLLTLQPKPMVYLNIPLAGCNSRITCICAVPGCPQPRSGRTSDASTSMRNHPRSAVRRSKLKSQLNSERMVGKAFIKDPDPARKESLLRTDSPNTSEMITADLFDKSRKNSVNIGEASTEFSSGIKSFLNVSDQPAFTLYGTPTDSPTLIEQSGASCLTDLLAAEAQQTEIISENFLTIENKESSPNAKSDTSLNEELDNLESTESSDTSDEDRQTMGDSSHSFMNTLERLPDDSNVSSEEQTYGPDLDRIANSSKLLDPYRPTMWLGTEEGSVFIFYATDNIKTSRQKQRIELQSSVTCILHLDVRMFVACLNGDIYVYERNSDGLWDVDAPRLIKIQPGNDDPVIVRRMLAVAGNIWCAARRFIYVLNSITLAVELSFPLNGNPADPRGIQLMAYGNQTVWLATENSPRVSLYHATTGEFLIEVDLKPIVLQSLKRCDEIVMRHKEACLRITCLTVCKDLLWVGTSAGIIVTVAIPRVYLGRTQGNMEPPQLEVIKQGHIGHVRFLVSLESPLEHKEAVSADKGAAQPTPASDTSQSTPEQSEQIQSTENRSESGPESSKPVTSLPSEANQNKSTEVAADQRNNVDASWNVSDNTEPGDTRSTNHQYSRQCLLGMKRASLNPCTVVSQMKVISGGDGYEEFADDDPIQQQSEQTATVGLGDNDNINHILIWDVH